MVSACEMRQKQASAFDKCHDHYNDRYAGSAKYEHRTIKNKPKVNRGMTRSDQVGITSSAQAIGFHEPYDRFIG